MTTDPATTQEFHIRSLKTRSVTLYPQRAQIVRDIKDISLKPGQNHVVIHGVTPLVDENSIRVEGTGNATITDLKFQLTAPKESYADVYPSDSEDSDSDESDSEDEDETLKNHNDYIDELNNKIALKNEIINSANAQLELLQHHTRSFEKLKPDELEQCLTGYREERAKIFVQHDQASDDVEKLKEKIEKAEKQRAKYQLKTLKANKAARREKEKAALKKQREREKLAAEKQRVTRERQKFWPKSVYMITITIDVPLNTPTVSRRNSIETLVQTGKEPEGKSDNHPVIETSPTVDLSLTYITWEASWLPRYDLNLNTNSKTGTLDYSAELINKTSETWTDAKVTLSTSQTSSEGLGKEIPVLLPWHLRLIKASGQQNTNNIISSPQELSQKKKHNTFDAQAKSHANHLGIYPASTISAKTKKTSAFPARGGLFGNNAPGAASTNGAGLFGGGSLFGNSRAFGSVSNSAGGGLFGSSINAVPPPPPAPAQAPAAPMQQNNAPALADYNGQLMLLEQQNQRRRQMARQEQAQQELMQDEVHEIEQQLQAMQRQAPQTADARFRRGGLETLHNCVSNVDESVEDAPKLDFEEGSWEESGLTTTYELPGVRTLAPSSTTSKQKIAKLQFSSVAFSHIAVPKLRTVTYLRAKIRNASKIALLKGQAGLTLDGSFLGQVVIPRCSVNESFTLNLGSDPSVEVLYPKPTVQRSQSGVFNREDSGVFTRTIILTNTKHNGPVNLVVHDQVPQSGDERLRVDLLIPKGLKPGTEVQTGWNTKDNDPLASASHASAVRSSVYGTSSTATADTKGKDWGTAIASAKKLGAITWDVKLNPGSSCKLLLQYECTYPFSESVANDAQTSN